MSALVRQQKATEMCCSTSEGRASGIKENFYPPENKETLHNKNGLVEFFHLLQMLCQSVFL